MTRHILLLCLLGNPFELNLGGHQRTVSEIINHFKDTPQLELTVITTNGSLKELTANHLCSNITIYEIPIKKQWLENQDLLYNNKDFLYKTIKNIYENIEQPIALVHSTYWISGFLQNKCHNLEEGKSAHWTVQYGSICFFHNSSHIWTGSGCEYV